jgi:hypothetical protein
LGAFKEEINTIKGQFRALRKEQLVSHRVMNRLQKMVMSAENMVGRVRLACQAADIERIYEAMDVPIPNKIKVAMFLVFQFESMDFNFEMVHREDSL